MIFGVMSILAGGGCLLAGIVRVVTGDTWTGLALMSAAYPWIRIGIEEIRASKRAQKQATGKTHAKPDSHTITLDVEADKAIESIERTTAAAKDLEIHLGRIVAMQEAIDYLPDENEKRLKETLPDAE